MIRKELVELVKNYNNGLEEAKSYFYRCMKEESAKSKLSEEEVSYILSNLNPSHITTNISKEIRKRSVGASFRVLLSNYILEKKFYRRYSIAPGANDKVADAKFVKSLGFQVPDILAEGVSAKESCKYDFCVIKAKKGASSKGIFHKKGDFFYHFFDNKDYSESEFIRYSESQGLNEFIVEEYVGGEDYVRDLKFYTFYGRVGVVLEIRRGKAGRRHCFYNADSEIIDSGRYARTSFSGDGFRHEERLCAEKISSAIPSPFVRVDMISNENGYWVGEITAHPGGYEEFNKEIDFILGCKFIEARARLLEDLLSGKEFYNYINRYNI